MGPEAGCSFYRRLIELTPARKDQEHPDVILYSACATPDRSDYLAGRGPSPVPDLTKAVVNLQQWGAQVIAIPCNTAHYFFKEMRQALEPSTRLLHIVDITAQGVVDALGRGGRAGVLGTRSTVRYRLYEKPLADRGLELVLPDAHMQEKVQESIDLLKAGHDHFPQAASLLQEALGNLASHGAQAAIFGCTELGLVEDRLMTTLKIFDSVDLLARATVQAALQEPAPSQAKAVTAGN